MSRLGNFLIAVGAALNEPERRVEVFRCLRRLHRLAFAGLLGCVIGFLLLCNWVGERNLLTTFFLFIPGQVWLIPLALFAGTSLLFLDWKLVFAVLFTGVALFWWHLDWQFAVGREGRGGPEVSVMTFNRGQRAGSLRPFKAKHRPDLLAMQEAGRQSAAYLKAEGYSDLPYGEDVGEFMLLSKYPIKDKGLVKVPAGVGDYEVAGWFVVDFEGREIVLYNVHMPTPREPLKAFRRGAFLRGLWPFSEASRSYQEFWDQQIALAQGLLEHVEGENRPTIVVGDFNTPDRGYIYSCIRENLQDAHEEAGSGFGWTFPGHTRNPLTLYGPWLRIDHQFASPGWRVLSSVVESSRKSQHLAVVASYELSQP